MTSNKSYIIFLCLEVKMEKFIALKEVSELIGYHPETIRQFVRAGKLKAYRRPTKGKRSQLKFRISDIEYFMQVENPKGEKRGRKKRPARNLKRLNRPKESDHEKA